MKSPLIALISVSLLVFAGPALAQSAASSSGLDLSQQIQHSLEMETLLKQTVAMSQRALDMLAMANSILENGNQKKDPKILLSGAKMAQQGLILNRQGLSSLKILAGSLHEHLIQAKFGNLKLSELEMTHLTQSMELLQKQSETGIAASKAESERLLKQASQMINLGNELMLKAKTDRNAELMMSGYDVLIAGTKLQTSLQPGAMHKSLEREIRLPGVTLLDSRAEELAE